MLSKTVSTGQLKPGERKKIRVEWGLPFAIDYVVRVNETHPVVQSCEQDADGVTLIVEGGVEPCSADITCTAIFVGYDDVSQPEEVLTCPAQ